MADPDLWVVVGRLGGPFGVKGWNKLSSFTDPPDNLFDYQPWRLSATRSEPPAAKRRRSDAGSTTVSTPDITPHRIEQHRRHQGRWVVKLAGIDDRDAAALLAGRDIYASANAFAAPPSDEYYWRDLIGMSVINGEGAHLGDVANLLETPRNDVLVVQTKQGRTPDNVDAGQPGETLIPFIDQYVIEVDADGRVIHVDWQADW